MDKYIGLRFNLQSSFFQIKMERGEVEGILLKFRSGQDEVVGGCDANNIVWAVKLKDVSFIHSFDWQQYEMQVRAQQMQQQFLGDAAKDPIHNCGSIQIPRR